MRATTTTITTTTRAKNDQRRELNVQLANVMLVANDLSLTESIVAANAETVDMIGHPSASTASLRRPYHTNHIKNNA